MSSGWNEVTCTQELELMGSKSKCLGGCIGLPVCMAKIPREFKFQATASVFLENLLGNRRLANTLAYQVALTVN